jgi:hypothetical protein
MLTIVVATVAVGRVYRPLRRFATLAVSQLVAFRRFATFCDAPRVNYVLTVIARDSAKLCAAEEFRDPRTREAWRLK